MGKSIFGRLGFFKVEGIIRVEGARIEVSEGICGEGLRFGRVVEGNRRRS